VASGELAPAPFLALWSRFTAAYPRASVVPIVLHPGATIDALAALLPGLSLGAIQPAGRDKTAAAPRANPLLALDLRAPARAGAAEAANEAVAGRRPRVAPRVEDGAALEVFLEERAARIARARASVSPAIPLPPGDAARLERVAAGLLVCHGELTPPPTFSTSRGAARVRWSRAPAATTMSVLLPFWDGRIDKSRPLQIDVSPRPPGPERAALTACVESSLLGVALASQRDPVEVTLRVREAPADEGP
jgi:hypothetical protein